MLKVKQGITQRVSHYSPSPLAVDISNVDFMVDQLPPPPPALVPCLLDIDVLLCAQTCRVVLSEAVDGCTCFTRKIQHGGD